MGGGFSFKFLLPAARFLAKKGLKLGKSVFKRAGPKILKTALATGADVVSGKNVKRSLKRGLRKGIGDIASSSRDALLDEVDMAKMMLAKNKRGMRGKGLMRLGRKPKIYFP